MLTYVAWYGLVVSSVVLAVLLVGLVLDLFPEDVTVWDHLSEALFNLILLMLSYDYLYG